MSSKDSYNQYIDSAAEVSYLNLLGIAVTVVFGITYIALSAHAIKYMKNYACKIKIVMNRAEEKWLNKKNFYAETAKPKSQKYIVEETALKNEVKRSRSLYFMTVFGCLMQKYDHWVYYPFRKRFLDKIELLRPRSTFFAMLYVASICFSWILSILTISLLQSLHDDVNDISLTTYCVVTGLISLATSIMSILVINRFFRLYELNVKAAFKIDYKKDFLPLEKGFEDYNPDNDDELEEIRMYQQIWKGKKIDSLAKQSQHTPGQLSSTRKLLLGDETQRTIAKGKLESEKTVMQEEEEEDLESNAKDSVQNNSLLATKMAEFLRKKNTDSGDALIKLFGINKDVDGFENIDKKQKYLFIEDKHHIGDQDLLENEATKGENKSNLITFVVMFLIIALGSVFCCYLNYYLSEELSRNVFYMFLAAFAADVLVLRIIILLLMALLKICCHLPKGYKRLKLTQAKLEKDMGNALKDMMMQNKSQRLSGKKKKELGRYGSEDYDQYINRLIEEQKFSHSKLGQISQVDEESKDQNQSQFLQNTHKKDDDNDGERIPNALDVLNKRFESPEQNIGDKQQTSSFNTQIPFLQNLQEQAQADEEKKEEEYLQSKKKIVNELADYNLLLYRKINDAYGDRSERVLKHFRNENNNVLRKKYLQSVVNPHYDYDKLMQDVKKTRAAQENKQDEEVKVDPEEVGEGEEHQEVQSKTEEYKADEEEKKYEREAIDRFGRKIQDDKELKVVLPQPAKGQISSSIEENTSEDDVDEWSRKMKELRMLREKKKRGEALTEEEERRLVQLEKEEDEQRHKEIEQLEQKGKKRTLEETDKMKQLKEEEDEYRNRRIDDLEDQEKKKGLDDEEKKEYKMLKEWQNKKKRSLLEELRQKLKDGTITDEEMKLLRELEEWEWQQKLEELEMLRRKQKEGKLTDEEARRLKELEQEEADRKWKELDELRRKAREGTLTEEEKRRLAELEDWAEMMRQRELEELRRKLKDGTITDEERRRLQELEDEEERRKKEELERLREKQRRGELTEEERRRLEELEEEERRKKQKEQDEWEKKRLKEIEEELKGLQGDLDDHQLLKKYMLEKEKCEILCGQLRRKDKKDMIEEDVDKIHEYEDEIERLEYEILLLKKKLGQLTDEEEQRLKLLETKRKMNDLSEIKEPSQKDEGEGQEQLYGEDEEENPFDKQNELNEEVNKKLEAEQKAMEEEQEEESSEIHGRLSDDEHFAELPAVEVMNKVDDKSRAESQKLTERSQKRQSEKDQSQIEQDEEEGKEPSPVRPSSQKAGEQERLLREQQEEQKKLEELEEKKKQDELAQKQQEQEQLQRQKQQEDAQRQQQQQHQEQQRQQQEQAERQQKEEMERQKQAQQQEKQLQEEKRLGEEQQHLSPKAGEQDQTALPKGEQTPQQKQAQKDEVTPKSAMKGQAEQERQQTAKSNVRFQDEQQQPDDSPMQFEEEQPSTGDQRGAPPAAMGEESAKASSRRSQRRMQQEDEMMESDQEIPFLDKSDKDMTQSQKSKKKEQEELEKMKSRSSLREADTPDVGGGEQARLSEEEERQKNMEFGHDDLDQQEESIYSHKTSTILDEEKVSFMHVDHLPNEDNASDNSFSEQDMVYYTKDDMTQYSQGLKLNKVPAKKNLPGQKAASTGKKGRQQQNYFSENDIQEMQNEEQEEVEDSDASVYSIDSQGRRYKKRGRRGRGNLRHNELESQSYNDQVDGRVKVDSWNLNYKGKKKKLKKRKLDDKSKQRMNDLQNIYGVDAKTLAGLQKGSLPRKGKGDDQSRFGNTEMSMRSTQNTQMMRQSQFGGGGMNDPRSQDEMSNMFSFHGGNTMSKRWNDIQTTLKGKKFPGDTHSGKKDASRRFGQPPKMKKFTSTQEDFMNKQPGYMEEERKSMSGSEGFGRTSFGGKGGKSGKKGATGKKAAGRQGDQDSYSESDEGVNDQSAVFQSHDEELHSELFGGRSSQKKGKGKGKGKAKKPQRQVPQFTGGMNDEFIDHHSESDEGVNEAGASFSGNEQDFIFKKRGFGEKSQMVKDSQTNKKPQMRSKGGRDSSQKKGSDIEVEDLEAQVFQNKNKKKKVVRDHDSSDEEGDLFGARFQKQNQASEYSNFGQRAVGSDVSDGEQRQQQRKFQANRQQVQGRPPLSKRHVSENQMEGLQGAGQRKKYMQKEEMKQAFHTDQSDGERMGGQGRKKQKRNRSNEDGGSDDDSYIIGPESNHSMIKNKNFKRKGSEQDRYMKVTRDREVVEDIDGGEGGNVFAKKRKIKRVSQSYNTRDPYAQRAEQERMDRLRKKRIEEEEKALIKRHRQQDGSRDASMSKMKKKKQKIDHVRKEVNYWLDYDSPYAEYLVARFREWSPQVAQQQQRAGSRQDKQKYSEMSKLYGNQAMGQTNYSNNREGNSRQGSKSKDRDLNNSRQERKAGKKQSKNTLDIEDL